MCAALLLIGGHAAAFTWFTYGGYVVVWAAATDTRWLSPDTFPPGSPAQIIALASAGAWNLTGGSSWTYTAGYASIYPPDSFDGYSYTEAVPGDYFDSPGVLAATLLGNYGAEWVDMDTLINAEAPNGWGWNLDPAPTAELLTNPGLYGFSLLQVLMHEFGHALGLGHEDTIVTLMNSYYPNGGTFGQEGIVEPHADDRVGQRTLYPGGIFTDLGNGNFYHSSFGGSAPIIFEPTAADPGDQIAARIQVENLGTTFTTNVRQGFYLSQDSQITTGDRFLGSLLWASLDAGAAGQFDVLINLPDDLPSGTWYLGSILDDTNRITEAFEDNNAVIYSEPLTVNFLPPIIVDVPNARVTCGSTYVSPAASVTRPQNVGSTSWTLVTAPTGASINPATGVVNWPNARGINDPHLVTVRATNAVGFDDSSFVITVDPVPPQIAPIGDQVAGCGTPYVGPQPSFVNPACSGDAIVWVLESGPPGMTINPDTGVVGWAKPLFSESPNAVLIRVFSPGGDDAEQFAVALIEGDTDGDANVDLDDYFRMVTCMIGPAGGVPASCACSDLDGDGDIDLRDFATFQAVE